MDTSILIAKSVTILVLLLSLLGGCGPTSRRIDVDTNIAEVLVNRVPNLDYDTIALALTPRDGSGFSLPRKEFSAVDGRLNIKVPVGTYALVLELGKAGKLVATTETCPPANRPASYTLKAGLNNLDVPVCSPTSASGVPFGGFSVVDGKLMDPSGVPFILRGVNTPHAYYLKDANASLPRIKTLGFNMVRIVWCADTLIRAGRCESKDIHPVAELEKTLALVKSQRLVAMLNLQNATGSDSLDHLEKMVEYLTRDDVKKVLLANKDNLLINIANEWYGTWDKTSSYIEGYRKVIGALRAAQLPHVLVVDARGYGQDVSSIAEHGQDLVDLDRNLMISAHLYDVFSKASSVANVFATVREKKLPFLVGEFSCSHGAQKPVACEAIMSEASRAEGQYGYIGWSYSGNGSSLKDLDVVELSDWSTLTSWGRTLIDNPSGIKATSREACVFRAPLPCSN